MWDKNQHRDVMEMAGLGDELDGDGGMNSAKRKASCELVFEQNDKAVNQFMAEVDKPATLSEADHKKMAKVNELYETAKKIGVTPDKLAAMRKYSAELKRKFPHMKTNRIQRKVAEQFKIKLT